MKLLVLAAALALTGAAQPPAPRVILVGDSTVQPDSGYGEKLCARFKPGVSCLNTAKGGRSTKSFRVEGRWNGVLLSARQGARSGRPTYVLIQFGHNDAGDIPYRHTEMEEFINNTKSFVREVKAAGAVPVLVTPLTRRQFRNGVVVADLESRAAAVRQVAAEEKVVLLDLYKDSLAAVQKMGAAEADTLAQAPPPPEVIAASRSGNSIEAPASAVKPAFDYTHVGDKGALVFSAIVANEIKQMLPALGAALR